MDEHHERRFGGLDRLYGDEARVTLHNGRVAVVGVGGVGSWAVEALARSGVGNITLIDFDQIAVSNVNRQIHALESTFGKAKVHALEERIRDINPACQVSAVEDFVTPDNVTQLLPSGAFDVVIDACDAAKAKAALIAHARAHDIALVVCGAAGGKSNPLNLKQADLGHVTHDALLARVRNRVRKEFQLRTDKKGRFGIPCIYSEEPSRRGASCATSNLSCSGYGSVVTVTGAMGFAAAALCIDRIVAKREQPK